MPDMTQGPPHEREKKRKTIGQCQDCKHYNEVYNNYEDEYGGICRAPMRFAMGVADTVMPDFGCWLWSPK